ncbi:sulfite exporter TauE/SafE family protein|uniref:Cytochrome c-type biogenesis protein n=1 Tax=Dendrosporobacter quercicolus TaxID=146817 RepID=A0A1G9MW39_9FIRM|nr:cytochrome c biogenesis protein CcdA [Dendrosporobacter quercicolus]NSL47152.1 sulfite exporter TauE/SafE family protein [Dendrosporobacter quercicolus DSM 1736]SDL78231.1 cytochrome c-type biogenesis protein [Dendrosporobacter quercicolus]
MTENVSLAAAFAAGIVSVLSPCVIPVLPSYAACLTGTATGRGKVVMNAVCFLGGFTAVFIVMGATASLLGQLFSQYQEFIRKFAAIFMMMMGGQLAGLFSFSGLNRDYRPLLPSSGQLAGCFRAFVLGAAITTGWTPCIGPVLATVLLYAGSTASLKISIGLLLAYAAGFAIPFLALTVLLNQIRDRLKKAAHLLPYIQKAAGVVILITGILLYFNVWIKLIGVVA